LSAGIEVADDDISIVYPELNDFVFIVVLLIEYRGIALKEEIEGIYIWLVYDVVMAS